MRSAPYDVLGSALVHGAITVGGHLLEVDRPADGRPATAWRLRCSQCLALVSHGLTRVSDGTLAGGQCLAALGGRPPVSWVWGVPTGTAGPERLVLRRGLRSTAVLPQVVTPGLWVAAVPGSWSRAVVTTPAGRSDLVLERLSAPTCRRPRPTTSTGLAVARRAWGGTPAA